MGLRESGSIASLFYKQLVVAVEAVYLWINDGTYDILFSYDVVVCVGDGLTTL